MSDPTRDSLAEAVRQACASAALRAHEDAGIQGLCPDGRWEAAVSAIRNLDLERLVEANREAEAGFAGPILLDGRAFARARDPDLATRVRAVAATRGFPPRLALVAFAAEEETPPFIARKLRACEAVGVDATAEVLPERCGSDRARGVVQRFADQRVDGIFIELPFPEAMDVEEVVEAVPEEVDIDVMTAARTRRYMLDGVGRPPTTVEAALALLDGYGVGVEGLDGVVVGEASSFTEMFREALVRRGARMRPLQAPESAAARVGDAQLVVSAAARPELLRADGLAADAVVIDAGYFNPGGRGDIDTTVVEHLRALAPVPGGIGPMTVSVLVQRVIEAAEAGSRAP